MDDAAAVNLETKKFNSKKMQQKYHIQAQAEYIYIKDSKFLAPALKNCLKTGVLAIWAE